MPMPLVQQETIHRDIAGCSAAEPSSFVIRLEQLRQPRDVDGGPPSLVRGEHLRLARLGLAVARVDVGRRLPRGVADDLTARDRVAFLSAR
jgi:hypothetical protein